MVVSGRNCAKLITETTAYGDLYLTTPWHSGKSKRLTRSNQLNSVLNSHASFLLRYGINVNVDSIDEFNHVIQTKVGMIVIKRSSITLRWYRVVRLDLCPQALMALNLMQNTVITHRNRAVHNNGWIYLLYLMLGFVMTMPLGYVQIHFV